jgi:hypothetical protein
MSLVIGSIFLGNYQITCKFRKKLLRFLFFGYGIEYKYQKKNQISIPKIPNSYGSH